MFISRIYIVVLLRNKLGAQQQNIAMPQGIITQSGIPDVYMDLLLALETTVAEYLNDPGPGF